MHRSRRTVAVLSASLLLAACGASSDVEVADTGAEQDVSASEDAGAAQDQSDEVDDTATSEPADEEAADPTEDTVIPTPTPSSEPDRPAPGDASAVGSGVVESLPGTVLDPVLADASDRLSLPVDELVLTTAAAVRYPDGSLGCPEPGLNYTQQVVSGYQVVVADGETVLDYRIGATGGFRLCSGGGTVPAPAPDPDV